MHRRRFLVAAASVAGGVLLVQGCGPEPAQRVADVAALLPSGAGRVGDAWRRLHGEDRVAAAQALLDDAPDGDLGRALAALARQDFVAGRTVEIDGWLLSWTECRLAAVT